MTDLKNPLTVALLILFLVVLAAFHRTLRWQALYMRSPAIAISQPPLRLPRCEGCNLIIISADTLRLDRIDWNQNGRTPNLAQMAARSLSFERAYTNAFYTTPSHMTLFTSLYPNRHKVTGSDVQIKGFARTGPGTPTLENKYQTLAEVLKKNGYRTSWFAPLTLKHLQLELGFGRGFDHFAPTLFQRPGRFEHTPQDFNSAPLLADLRLNSKPFFYFIHSYITHLPYFVEQPPDKLRPVLNRNLLLKKFSEQRRKTPPIPNFNDADRSDPFLHALGQFQLRLLESKDPAPSRPLRRAYDSAVQEFDRQFGQLWRALEQSGRLQNTIVVLLSDHGEELFEHGHASHSNFYQHTAAIPLLMYHPKLAYGMADRSLVSLIDVMPTVLSLLGQPVPEQAQGRDLSGGEATLAARPVFGFSLGSSYVFDGEWKLVSGASGEDELYNIRLDPNEKYNLIHLWWPKALQALTTLQTSRSRWEMEQNL